MKEKDYRLWLRNIHGVGNKTFIKLIDYFGSAKDIFQAPEHVLLKVKGINQDIIHNIIENRDHKTLNHLINQFKKYHIDVLCKEDEKYPENLKHIYDPPEILYKKGSIVDKDKNAVAIVGARKASTYGKWVAYKLASDLAKKNITVISGMAYGIDTAAHRGALDHGGRTVAVLGCGLDICYPKSNYNLMLEIEEKGAILSEYPIGTKPLSGNFPARNRIISGIAKGVVIVEANMKSGSLITAEFALEQGRDVFAIPGNINSPLSMGTNKLIQEGAKLITSIEDIIEELDIEVNYVEEQRDVQLSSIEKEVYNIILKKQPIHMELLQREVLIDVNKINGIITILELKGLIQQLPGKILIAK
ncbi:DNA-processing protein DprA [Clostridiaceae bacterium 35-E11]